MVNVLKTYLFRRENHPLRVYTHIKLTTPFSPLFAHSRKEPVEYILCQKQKKKRLGKVEKYRNNLQQLRKMMIDRGSGKVVAAVAGERRLSPVGGGGPGRVVVAAVVVAVGVGGRGGRD
jgi:hypothetical protein